MEVARAIVRDEQRQADKALSDVSLREQLRWEEFASGGDRTRRTHSARTSQLGGALE